MLSLTSEPADSVSLNPVWEQVRVCSGTKVGNCFKLWCSSAGFECAFASLARVKDAAKDNRGKCKSAVQSVLRIGSIRFKLQRSVSNPRLVEEKCESSTKALNGNTTSCNNCEASAARLSCVFTSPEICHADSASELREGNPTDLRSCKYLSNQKMAASQAWFIEIE